MLTSCAENTLPTRSAVWSLEERLIPPTTRCHTVTNAYHNTPTATRPNQVSPSPLFPFTYLLGGHDDTTAIQLSVPSPSPPHPQRPQTAPRSSSPLAGPSCLPSMSMSGNRARWVLRSIIRMGKGGELGPAPPELQGH